MRRARASLSLPASSLTDSRRLICATAEAELQSSCVVAYSGVVATASTSALCHGSAPDHSASCHRRLMKVSRCHEGEQAAAPLLAKRKRSQSKAQPKGKAKPKAKGK